MDEMKEGMGGAESEARENSNETQGILRGLGSWRSDCGCTFYYHL